MLIEGNADYLQVCILGCIVADGRTVDSEGITEDLFSGAYREIFGACEAILARSGPLDPMTIGTELGSDRLAAVGGATTLHKVVNQMGVAARVDQYIAELRNLREATYRETLALTLAKKQDLCRSDFADALNAIDANEHGRIAPNKIGDAVQDALLRLYEPETKKGIKTGIAKFDSQYLGISELYTLVAAYPGIGKSTFIVSLAVNFALSGRKVLLWSGEDDTATITERAIVRLAGGRTAPQLAAGATKAKDLDIWIDETAGISADGLSALCRSYVKHHGVDIILLDHLGKIREPGNSPYERATNASGKVADIQKNLGVPLIAASQLRRQKGNAFDLPSIDDLRDSGMLEADARQIILLHRPHYFFEVGKIDERPDPNEMWLIVGKNNHGKTGRLKVHCEMSQFYIGDQPGTTERGTYHDDY